MPVLAPRATTRRQIGKNSTYEAAAICADCDGECRYSMRLLAGTG